ncbi:MAG TPA: phenylalanine--tRNA ligase beta subunit-related protein [Sedimentibacter sp.]|nr:phenylalanine--tRNA ligase beta subunit-related protein [Sedimentibacter sp.]
MTNIYISEKLKNACSAVVLGCIQATVCLKEIDKNLFEEINIFCRQVNESTSMEQIADMPEIIDAREAYKSLGKSPSRYRVSSEALLRRVVQGKGLYQINNVVDINNLVSLKSHYSVGTYDLDKLKPPIYFTVGGEGQTYKGIGKELINIENMPVFADSAGNFGGPTSDSERAMITMNTTKILMNIISFSGDKGIEEYMNYASELLAKYAEGKEIITGIVR